MQPLCPDNGPLLAWNFVNVDQLKKQITGPLLPAYIQEAPNPAWTSLPYRSLPQLELTEGPHMGYAIQWFAFAAILGLGYPFFIQRQEIKTAEDKNLKASEKSVQPSTSHPG